MTTTTPCHERTGVYTTEWGYTRVTVDGKQVYAHRAAIAAVGFDQYGTAFGDDLVVMHECDTPACTRYTHLRLGTQKENLRDMYSKKRHRGNGTHCKQGHEFDVVGVYVSSTTGNRQCALCAKQRAQR